MASLKNTQRDCSGLNKNTVIGFLGVSIGASGAPTVAFPVAGVTIVRNSAGVYSLTLPTDEGVSFIAAFPYTVQSSTIVGFIGGALGTQVTCLAESGGVLSATDPANGDILGFLIVGLLG